MSSVYNVPRWLAGEKYPDFLPASLLCPEHERLDTWLSDMPRGIRRELQKIWRKIANKNVNKNTAECSINTEFTPDNASQYEANLLVTELIGKVKNFPISLAATDEEICDFADNQVFEYKKMLARGDSLEQCLFRARLFGVAHIPAETSEGLYARLVCPMFWRRHLRKTLGRRAEEIARNDLGLVTRRKQIYCSNDTLARRRHQKRRNLALLEACIAINQLGQEFTLAELMEKSNSNPEIRRAELMTRIAGFESIAVDLDHAGEFITLTCPSRFHARRAVSGTKNPKFDGSTPAAASNYLGKVWARITSQLAREGIVIYGFRVVEPHHDGTPHWHGLFFMDKADVLRFRQIVARHGCRDCANELGLHYLHTKGQAKALARSQRQELLSKAVTKEQRKKVPSIAKLLEKIKDEKTFWDEPPYWVWVAIKARVEFKEIDWSGGRSAAGYIAKYISKNIDGRKEDGESIGLDFETTADNQKGVDACETAERVDAWASVWGIRQFQQIGGAPVSIWRELRRYDYQLEGGEHVLLSAALAADVGDWGKFISIMGGWSARRKDMPLKLFKVEAETLNRYGEPAQKVQRGVVEVETGFLAITRENQWQIKLGDRLLSGGAAPWTCVNNSTFLTKATPQNKLQPHENNIKFEELEHCEVPPLLGDIDQLINEQRIKAKQQKEISEARRILNEVNGMLRPKNRGLEVIRDIKNGLMPVSLPEYISKTTKPKNIYSKPKTLRQVVREVKAPDFKLIDWEEISGLIDDVLSL